ncbi:MAG: YceI family protein [Bdellovibrionales bacterium]|nr:YceI family protein [Bdellovibrionales bacterium]
MRLLTFLLVGVVSQLSFAASIEKVDFPEGKSCVAYKTKKVLFLVSTVTVVGQNCQVSAEVIPEPDNNFHLEIGIPISGFKSGEAERDREVAQLLKVDVAKDLEFISESISMDQWRRRIAQGEFDLSGDLKIGKKKYKITIEISQTPEEAVFVGRHRSKFKKFDMEPPKLLAGLGAKVSDKLQLLFQLNTSEVLGAQSIIERKSEL